MKDLTLREAVAKWVDIYMDEIKTNIIAALMDYDPENWHEITRPVIGSTVFVYDRGKSGEIIGCVE